MTNKEAVNWLINITADIGKVEHYDLWHYEQALTEIKEMLENVPDTNDGEAIAEDINVPTADTITRQAAIEAVKDAIIEAEWEYAENAIKQLPPAPERTGHWILFDERFPWANDYNCSKCGKMFRIEHKKSKTPEETFRFCPYCGQPKKAKELS